MRILLVSRLLRSGQAMNTIAKYTEVGRALGHEVAVFGESQTEVPGVPMSLDVQHFDYALFVVYWPLDFPDLPYLARLLDGMPRERRVVMDCTGRYNDTVRIEHDFNHLQKLDGHQGWEWIEGLEAISDLILQPTLTPRRPNVKPFLFHGFDPAAVERTYASAAEAARVWAGIDAPHKPFGTIYVGNNWQRWTQLAPFYAAAAPLRERIGPSCLVGWDWTKRAEWAIELGIAGIDVDPELLKRLGVEVRGAVPYDEVVKTVGQARFAPVCHRPLFNELALVTNRTFETFCSDTMPLLLLPTELIDAIYGPAARALAPGDDVTGRMETMLADPEPYWEAVLATREHLARHHSFQRRFEELVAILEAGEA